MSVRIPMPKYNSMMTFVYAVISMIGCGSCWPLSWIPLNTLVRIISFQFRNFKVPVTAWAQLATCERNIYGKYKIGIIFSRIFDIMSYFQDDGRYVIAVFTGCPLAVCCSTWCILFCHIFTFTSYRV